MGEFSQVCEVKSVRLCARVFPALVARRDARYDEGADLVGVFAPRNDQVWRVVDCQLKGADRVDDAVVGNDCELRCPLVVESGWGNEGDSSRRTARERAVPV